MGRFAPWNSVDDELNQSVLTSEKQTTVKWCHQIGTFTTICNDVHTTWQQYTTR